MQIKSVFELPFTLKVNKALSKYIQKHNISIKSANNAYLVFQNKGHREKLLCLLTYLQASVWEFFSSFRSVWTSTKIIPLFNDNIIKVFVFLHCSHTRVFYFILFYIHHQHYIIKLLIADVTHAIHYTQVSCFWNITKKNTSTGVIMRNFKMRVVVTIEGMTLNILIRIHVRVTLKARTWNDFCKEYKYYYYYFHRHVLFSYPSENSIHV